MDVCGCVVTSSIQPASPAGWRSNPQLFVSSCWSKATTALVSPPVGTARRHYRCYLRVKSAISRDRLALTVEGRCSCHPSRILSLWALLTAFPPPFHRRQPPFTAPDARLPSLVQSLVFLPMPHRHLDLLLPVIPTSASGSAACPLVWRPLSPVSVFLP
jgi:hypothetical protein